MPALSVAERQRKFRERLSSVKEREKSVSELRAVCKAKLLSLGKDTKWAKKTKRPVRQEVDSDEKDRTNKVRASRREFQLSTLRWLEKEEERLNKLMAFCHKVEQEWELVKLALEEDEDEDVDESFLSLSQFMET